MTLTNEKIMETAVQQYISRYDSGFSFDSDNSKYSSYLAKYNNDSKKIRGLITVLLQWIFDEITYTRKETSHRMYELCQSGWQDKKIHEYVSSFLSIDNDFNDKLDIAIENQKNYKSWFDIFYDYDSKDFTQTRSKQLIYYNQCNEISAICDNSRQYYRDNIGLDTIDYIVKLITGVDTTTESHDKLTDLFARIEEVLPQDIRNIIHNIAYIMQIAKDHQRAIFGDWIGKNYPEELISIYNQLQDYGSLGYILGNANNKMKKAWEDIPWKTKLLM